MTRYYLSTRIRQLTGTQAALELMKQSRPEPLAADVIEVDAISDHNPTVAYMSWDAVLKMNWTAFGGQSTGHTEALRIVSGSETAVHPAGWPDGEVIQGGPAFRTMSPLRLTASDLAALSSSLESFEEQMTREWVKLRGMYGNGY